MTHAEIIQLLGGPTKLAAQLGLSSATAMHWPRRGIPALHWPLVEQTAMQAGHTHITTQMLRETRPVVDAS